MANVRTLLMVSSILSVAPIAAIGQTNADATDNAAADLVATQVREQGYVCQEPTSASRDPDSEDDAVWTLNCANTSYRVRLVPDMAAQIEQIE